MIRRDDTCLANTFTGESEGPHDEFASAGRTSGCEDYYHLTRWNVGLAIAVPLSRRVGLRIDPGLQAVGYEHYHRSLTTMRLDYVQLPVHARLLLVPSGPVRPYVLAGGFVAHRRRTDAPAELRYWDDRNPYAPPTYRFREERWRGWNAGVSGGAGVLFEVRPLQVYGEAVYERGLVDVYGGRNIVTRSRDRRIAGGLAFRLGRR